MCPFPHPHSVQLQSRACGGRMVPKGPGGCPINVQVSPTDNLAGYGQCQQVAPSSHHSGGAAGWSVSHRALLFRHTPPRKF